MTDLESGVENEVNPERRRQMKRKLGGAGPGVFLRSKSYISVTEVKGQVVMKNDELCSIVLAFHIFQNVAIWSDAKLI